MSASFGEYIIYWQEPGSRHLSLTFVQKFLVCRASGAKIFYNLRKSWQNRFVFILNEVERLELNLNLDFSFHSE